MPTTPGQVIYIGADGGPFTVVGTNNPLPITIPGTATVLGAAAEAAPVSGNPVRVCGWDGTNARTLTTDASGRPIVVGGAADGATIVGNPLLMGASQGGGNVATMRTPNVFKSVQATASGDTAVWTPAGGKKFRLMRLMVQVTANAILAARGVLTIKVRDATTDLNITHDVYLGQTAIATDPTTSYPGFLPGQWIDLGNGVLSLAANNALNVNLSAALSAGNVRVTACGTEE